MLQSCPEISGARDRVHKRLQAVCGVGVTMTGILEAMCGRGQVRAPEARSGKKAWLRALNLAIGEMMNARDALLPEDAGRKERKDESWEEVERAALRALVIVRCAGMVLRASRNLLT